MSGESTASRGGVGDFALLIPAVPVSVPENRAGLEHVREFIRASKADNTIRGYQADWRDFCAWCESRGGLCPLPATADAVAAYIAICAGRLKPGSIQRRLNAIAEAHKAAGLESPTHAAIVRNTLKGIRRMLGTAPTQKAAALTDDIRAMIDAHARWHHWRAGPGTNPARVRRRIPPFGAGKTRCGGLRVQQGWPDRDATAIQGRSGGGGPEDRYTLRVQS